MIPRLWPFIDLIVTPTLTLTSVNPMQLLKSMDKEEKQEAMAAIQLSKQAGKVHRTLTLTLTPTHTLTFLTQTGTLSDHNPNPEPIRAGRGVDQDELAEAIPDPRINAAGRERRGTRASRRRCTSASAR